MEYLTLDLLEKMDSDDPNVAKEAEQQWRINDKLHYNKYTLCKKKLSKRLVHILDNCHFFHDTYIQEFSFKKVIGKKRDTFDLILTMQYDGYDEPLNGQLIHRNVHQLNCNFLDLNKYVAFGDYLYGEIFLNEQKLWIHNFLFFKDSEVNILCEKIEWIDK